MRRHAFAVIIVAVAQPPVGTVTFLFSDIEGSTRLWEDEPELMRELVAKHDERCRAAIAENGGYVVKATGDGFHAAFARAADAVRAAQHIVAATADLPGLNVRIGINTGEVQERDGDYFGPAVNRAARLMAAGHGGQVLLSGVSADLVPGLTLRNLGEHRLRDLAGPMVVWQLGTDTFPPLRTLDEVPGNLPMQRTSFIGRAEEVAQVAALIESEQLVTLTGPGGVGKSRLAVQVAAEVAPAFKDGVWFASLASLQERALVAPTILSCVQAPERHGEAAIDTLCGWANSRVALLVIDNCEHLLHEVAAVVDRIADTSATVRLLVTSQEPLMVRGEHVWTVAPLSGRGRLATASVELFVDRARMARGDFTLSAETEPVVLDICDRLDHVPLAIELAAARMRGMTPADIARRLDQRLRLLTSGDRLAPDRHRTLLAAMDWSYGLLDSTQRSVFDRLSVFAGPFTIEAATSVVSGDGVEEWEVLDVIIALVDKSLVTVDETSTGARYRLLETMRQFGSGNLAEARVDDTYRTRHADYYADYVLSRQPQLHGAGDQQALDEIEAEFENIRVALRQAVDDRSSARFENMYSALYLLWIARPRLSEGLAWATELLHRSAVEPSARVTALGFAANVVNGSDLALAKDLAVTAVDLAERTHQGVPLLSTAVLSISAMMQGDVPDAIDSCDRLITMVQDESQAFVQAEALVCAMGVLTVCNVPDRVRELVPTLADAVQRSGSEYHQAGYHNSLAPIIHVIDPDHASEYLERGYQRQLVIGNRNSLGMIAMFTGLHHLRSGRIDVAANWARRSLELAIETSPSFVAQSINTVIAVIKRSAPEPAAVLLGALSAHRERRRQAGSPPEIGAEKRYAEALRQALGPDFDSKFAQGHALDEQQMVSHAFNELARIQADPQPE